MTNSKHPPLRKREIADVSNVSAARMVAAITALASVLQHTHGHHKPTPMAVDQEVPTNRLPAVDALIQCSHYVLASRTTPAAKLLTQKMARQNNEDFLRYCGTVGASYLEKSIAILQTLEGLRKAGFGMPTDENPLSLTIYNIHLAYKDLIDADLIEVRRDVVDKVRGFRTLSQIH